MSSKRWYSAKEVADIITQDLPLGDVSDTESLDFDSDTEPTLDVDQIATEQDSIAEEYELSSYTESSTVSEVESLTLSEDDSVVDDEPTVDEPAVVESAAPVEFDVQIQEPNDDINVGNYKVDQDRKWKKEEKERFSTNFSLPQGLFGYSDYCL